MYISIVHAIDVPRISFFCVLFRTFPSLHPIFYSVNTVDDGNDTVRLHLDYFHLFIS